MDFALDTNAAKAADNMSLRISESGPYVGIITRAEAITSSAGTKGVELAFKDDAGATAEYIQLWTHNSSGELLAGYKKVMALLTCLSLRGAKKERVKVEKFDNGQRVKVEVDGYPDMMNKPVGLFLQKELYNKNNGGDGERMLLMTPFNSTDRKTASEILNKTPATRLDALMTWIADNPVKDSRRNAPSHSAPTASSQQSGGAFSDFDDDIPF